jgi:RND superfamily putative drug exporter
MAFSPSNRPTNLAGRMGRWSATHRKVAILGWFGFVLVAILAGMTIGQNKISDVDGFSGESHRAEQALDEAGLRPTSEAVFVRSRDLTIDDPAFRAAVQDTSRSLSGVRYVEKVQSPLGGGGDVTIDRHAALVKFEIAGDSEETADRVDPVLTAVDGVQARHPALLIEQFGDASANKAVNETVNDDLAKAGELSIPITLIILILTFGSLVAAGIPLLIGITSVMAALMLVGIPSQLFPVDDNLPAVILMIGLAVGVDYSLFYLRREREERAKGRSPEEALQVAAATSGRSVLISGLTVMVAMAGMLISGDKTFIAFAVGTILVVAIAVLASLTVLPAMLSWLGDRVEKGRLPVLGRRRGTARESRLWPAIIDRVMRRPALALVLAGGALLALAIPAVNLKTVVSGVDDLPQDLAVIKTYNRIKQAFPTEGVTATVVVKADDVRSGETAAGIDYLRRQLQASIYPPGTDITYSEDGTVAKIDVATSGTGTDAASTNALNEIRDNIIPDTIGDVEGTSVNVSGDAAASVDFRDQLNSRLPLIFAFVFGLAFVLFLVTFRSIVIPIKAILLNLLSVGAAYGVLVLVFQHGNGESLLGFSSNGGVASWLPLFLFVILFGLSMDYHVFILSRVRELHDGGMKTDEAVRHGITQTASTVTSAAIVMVGVFTVFATLSFLDLKELGLGLAVAVLIDATIVRAILLPASMRILGDWNWYLPRWLEWLPRVAAEGDAAGRFRPEGDGAIAGETEPRSDRPRTPARA